MALIKGERVPLRVVSCLSRRAASHAITSEHTLGPMRYNPGDSGIQCIGNTKLFFIWPSPEYFRRSSLCTLSTVVLTQSFCMLKGALRNMRDKDVLCKIAKCALGLPDNYKLLFPLKMFHGVSHYEMCKLFKTGLKKEKKRALQLRTSPVYFYGKFQ